MSVFNKKQIKKLEKEIEDLKNKNIALMNSNYELKGMNESISYLRKENEELVNWVQKILKALGTMRVDDIEHLKIPIIKKNSVACAQNPYNRYSRAKTGETIEIPRITISFFSQY